MFNFDIVTILVSMTKKYLTNEEIKIKIYTLSMKQTTQSRLLELKIKILNRISIVLQEFSFSKVLNSSKYNDPGH